MPAWYRAARKHLLVYAVCLRNSLIAELEYRVNFVAGIAVECGYLLAKMLFVVVIYRSGVRIGGLSPDATLLCIGTYVIMTGLYMGLFAVGFGRLQASVRDGSLDALIVKPVSLQFIATLCRVDFGMPIPNLTAGITLVIVGWCRAGVPCTPLHSVGYLIFIVCGVALTYALFLLPSLITFWTVKAGAATDCAASLWDFNNLPMYLYGNWAQRLGTFLIPVFVITNFAPLFVLGRLQWYYVAWGLAVPLLALLVCRSLWSVAIRRYTSASS